VHKRIISAVKKVEFVIDRMPYIIPRSHWYYIIVLNVYAPTVDKIDDSKESFYEELEHVFDTFPKYHTKILLGDFNAPFYRSPYSYIGRSCLRTCFRNARISIVTETAHKIFNTEQAWYLSSLGFGGLI
jgi:hypothetical protein